MKTEDSGFFATMLKTHKSNWNVSLYLFCVFLLVCFAQTILGAALGTTVVDADGDIATVQLSGSGTIDVTSLFRAACDVSLGPGERTQNERQAVYD
jgi:basic membrane lipoprotein Med (substrate-binding protein (PBP1-ABC) superfamily)